MSDLLYAGRPVFREVKLEDLVFNSHIIAVVQRREPSFFSNLTQQATKLFRGCARESWTLVLQDILLLQWKTRNGEGDLLEELELSKNFVPGKTVIARINKAGYEDCLLRLENPSGASFSSNRYIPSNFESAASGNVFFVFLRLKDRELQLTVDNAFEDFSQRKNIEDLLRTKIAGTGGGSRSSRVSIDCGPCNIDCATEQHCDHETGKWYCGVKR